ncbi:hypothetical protein ACCT30_44250, partial [Rhizobium ruizarguesonis]
HVVIAKPLHTFARRALDDVEATHLFAIVRHIWLMAEYAGHRNGEARLSVGWPLTVLEKRYLFAASIG